ncbi:MAG TPA: hypothetical protein VK943_02770 [Arenibaculum sp.]|nr:hypothetical protein [Arenibaculum sp.]
MPPPASPAAPATVVQAARLSAHNSRPPDAVGTVRRFKLGGTIYLTDSRNQQWWWHSGGHWVKKKKASVPAYNRFTPTGLGLGMPRKASFASRHGSGASYAGKRHAGAVKSSPIAAIGYGSRAKRTYTINMTAAATADGVATSSATTYATTKGAPAIVGGYNWCHLIGHGGGGSDTAANVVAASTHANSEQLEIEKILYRYKKKGVAAQVTAQLHAGSAHVATKLIYTVYFEGKPIYVREIDGFRSTKPSYVEMAAVEVNLSTAIYEAAEI